MWTSEPLGSKYSLFAIVIGFYSIILSAWTIGNPAGRSRVEVIRSTLNVCGSTKMRPEYGTTTCRSGSRWITMAPCSCGERNA